jgi:hypothetical protein
MSITGSKRRRIPEKLISGMAMQWLLSYYNQNSEFVREREAIRLQYCVVPTPIAKRIAEKFLLQDQPITSEKLVEMLIEVKESEIKESFSQHEDCVREYNELCLRWHLDYPWAPVRLFLEDLVKTIDVPGVPEEWKWLILPVLGAIMAGLPPIIYLPLPLNVVLLLSREQIHRIVDYALDNLLPNLTWGGEDLSWKDVRHGIPLHTKWLYAYKALGMTPEQIWNDPRFTPVDEDDYPTASFFQIRRAIRNIDRLLGGQPRPPGRPKKVNP